MCLEKASRLEKSFSESLSLPLLFLSRPGQTNKHWHSKAKESLAEPFLEKHLPLNSAKLVPKDLAVIKPVFIQKHHLAA